MRWVRDDPGAPDDGFAEAYASLPDATRLEPWLRWCRAAEPPVLYAGVGAGRLAVPLARAGVDLVGVDPHPGMLERLRPRLPGVELHQSRIEDLAGERRFDLVIGPAQVLGGAARLRAAARLAGRRVGLELVNPHWLAAGGGGGTRVRSLTRDRAVVEIDYPGGVRQLAEVELVWPEALERHLDAAGLELELLTGSDPAARLEECPTFLALTEVWPPRAAGWRGP